MAAGLQVEPVGRDERFGGQGLEQRGGIEQEEVVAPGRRGDFAEERLALLGEVPEPHELALFRRIRHQEYLDALGTGERLEQRPVALSERGAAGERLCAEQTANGATGVGVKAAGHAARRARARVEGLFCPPKSLGHALAEETADANPREAHAECERPQRKDHQVRIEFGDLPHGVFRRPRRDGGTRDFAQEALSPSAKSPRVSLLPRTRILIVRFRLPVWGCAGR